MQDWWSWVADRLYASSGKLDSIQRDVDQIRTDVKAIKRKLNLLSEQEAEMAVDFTAMNAELARNTSLTASIAQVVNTLVDMLANIPPSSDPVTQAALDDLRNALATNDDAIAAAVVAGTPAAPPV